MNIFKYIIYTLYLIFRPTRKELLLFHFLDEKNRCWGFPKDGIHILKNTYDFFEKKKIDQYVDWLDFDQFNTIDLRDLDKGDKLRLSILADFISLAGIPNEKIHFKYSLEDKFCDMKINVGNRVVKFNNYWDLTIK